MHTSPILQDPMSILNNHFAAGSAASLNLPTLEWYKLSNQTPQSLDKPVTPLENSGLGILYIHFSISAGLQEGDTEGGEKELQQLGLNKLGGKNTLHPVSNTKPGIVELWTVSSNSKVQIQFCK